MLSDVFGLSQSVADVVRHDLNGPKPEGAPALLIDVARGRFEQVVVNVPGPIELWALTTSPRDVALRDRVRERLMPAAARAALARRFPGGSARGEIEQAEARGERDAVDRLADEIVSMAHDGRQGREAGTAG